MNRVVSPTADQSARCVGGYLLCCSWDVGIKHAELLVLTLRGGPGAHARSQRMGLGHACECTWDTQTPQ